MMSRRKVFLFSVVLALFVVSVCGETTTGGFMRSILSPLTSSLRHARNFLGNGGQTTGPPPPAQAPDSSAAGQAGDPSIHGRLFTAGLDKLREQAFNVFAHLYNKSYSAQELPRRMKLFFERRREIEDSIKAYAEGRLPFMMSENAYVDWDQRELKTLTGVEPPKRPDEFTPEDRQALLKAERRHALMRQRRSATNESSQSSYSGPDSGAGLMPYEDEFDEFYEHHQAGELEGNDELDELDESKMIVKQQRPPRERIPARKDWRSSGCVAAPINQQKCGACYAIATMGVLETMRCLNKVSSPTLSPQQVVDCSRAYNNFGCNGGWPTRVLKYLQDTGVAAREACYPFVRRQLACRLRQVQSMGPGCTVRASPTDASRISYKVLNNERDILYHVAKTGPVVTVMRATDKFLYYGSGIFDDATCSRRRDDVDHAIVIVGYGKQNGLDYWLIKNSWGTSWGQAGYGLYRRGTNACSIGHWGWVITS